MDDELKQRLDEIERRLCEVESALGHAHRASDALPPATPAVVPHAPVAHAVVAQTVVPHTVAPPPLPIPPLALAGKQDVPNDLDKRADFTESDRYADNMRRMWDTPPEPAEPDVAAAKPVTASAGLNQPIPVEPIRPLQPTAAIARPLQYRQDQIGGVPANATFEQTVGLKWAGWIGAVVLVIGAALGFKYAYDQGWLTIVPPVIKIGLLAMCGLALMGVGEVVFRRVNRMSAVGFFGSGTAVLFLASYAGFAWYGLYEQSIAVALMGAATFAGMLAAARTDFVSVAVLAIVGGNLGPLLISETTPAFGPFLLYLLLLQGMALGLCAWQASPKWWSLRGLSLVTTTLWMLILAGTSGKPIGLELVFAVMFTLLFQGELCFTTLRAQRRQITLAAPEATGLVFSLMVTAAFTAWCLLIERDASSTRQGLILVAIAAGAYAASFGLRSLRQNVLGGVELSLRVQSALLLMLAIPIALTGPSLLFGWMLLAIGFGVIALATGRKLPLVGAMATWLLAGVFTGMWAAGDASSHHNWLTLLGEPLQARLIVAACLALSGHALGVIVRPLKPSGRPGDLSSFADFGVDAIAIATLTAGLFFFCSPAFATIAALLYSAGLFAVSYSPPFQPLGILAILLLCATTMKWAVVDVLAPLQGSTPAPPQRMLLNGQVLVGGLLTIAFGVMGWLQSRRMHKDGDPAHARRASLSAAIILALMTCVAGFTLTMEVQRYCDTAAGQLSAWPENTVRDLLVLILWSGCVAAWLGVTWIAARDAAVRLDVLRVALVLALVLCGGYVMFGILVPAANAPPAAVAVGINLQVLAGLVAIALLSGVIALARKTGIAASGVAPPALVSAAEKCAMVIPLMLLIIGSVEIDRFAHQQTTGPVWMVRQVGWSIYWAALAIASLMIGFARHLKALRVAALGLLALTLAKVTLVDLSTAGSGWRILSFLGLGLMLLATSVLYGKFSHRAER